MVTHFSCLPARRSRPGVERALEDETRRRRSRGLGLGDLVTRDCRKAPRFCSCACFSCASAASRVAASGLVVAERTAVMSAMLPARALPPFKKVKHRWGTEPYLVRSAPDDRGSDRPSAPVSRSDGRSHEPDSRGVRSEFRLGVVDVDLPLVVAPGGRVALQGKGRSGERNGEWRLHRGFAGKPDWSSYDTIFPSLRGSFALRWHPRRFLGTAPLFGAPAWSACARCSRSARGISRMIRRESWVDSRPR